METNRDFECYIPKHNLLTRAHRLFASPAEGEGFSRYRTDDFIDRATKSVLMRFLERMESVAGELYSFQASSSFVPQHLQKVLTFLYKKGVINSPEFLIDPPFNDEPKFYLMSLNYSVNSEALIKPHYSRFGSAGASFDFEEAASKALGEFLERYALLPFLSYKLIRSSPRDFIRQGKAFLSPEEVTQFSQEQREKNALFRVNEASSFLWVNGRSLFHDSNVLIPAQLVFLCYNADALHEKRIRESNSNGAAGMFSFEESLLSGLRELIQRDGFLIFWLNTIAPPKIDLSSIEDEDIMAILQKLRRYRFQVEILDITTDIGLPSFMAVLFDGEGKEKKISVGAGCEAMPERAIRKALCEAMAVYHVTRKKDRFSLPSQYIPFETKGIGQSQRMSLWMNAPPYKNIEWFLEGPTHSLKRFRKRHRISSNPAEELAFLIERFKHLGRGYEIYYFRPKNEVLDALEYHAVKVIVPALVSLYLNEQNAPLGASRLRQIPQKLGYQKVTFPNPFPHPFS